MTLTSTFTDNSSTLAQQSDVGFKISKPGYDAHTTQGSNMVFDSSWPSLPIAFETKITNPITSTGSTATIAHNLKFPPFTQIWGYGPDPSGVGNVGTRYFPSVDGTNVYLNGNFLATSQRQQTALFASTTLKIRCFQLDLSTDIDYILAPGDTFNQAYDSNFGIKVVKQGKDINSTDLRDFALHSRAQSPLILAVKTEKTIATTNINAPGANLNTIQYTTKLRYPAWVYGFIRAGSVLAGNLGITVNSYVPAPYYAQAYPITKTDGLLSYLTYNTGASGDNGATLVILRDPMFAATSTTVQY